MDFLQKNNDQLSIIQKLLDNDLVLFGTAVPNLLMKHKVNKVDMYTNNINIEKLLDDLKDNYKIAQQKLSKNKEQWIVNEKMTIIFHYKKPNPKQDTLKLQINKYGIQKMDQTNIFDSLNILRELNNKKQFDDKQINLSRQWISYLLDYENSVYGGWLSRYIICEDPNEMNRDIDVLSNDIIRLNKLMILLQTTKVCEVETVKANFDNNTYIVDALKVKINIDTNSLQFDVHKKSEAIDCDAYFNNLNLTKDYITVNYEGKKLNFISNLILVFNDIFNKNYTLMKKIPEKVVNKSDFRLLSKPLQMVKESFNINYDYLNFLDDK